MNVNAERSRGGFWAWGRENNAQPWFLICPDGSHEECTRQAMEYDLQGKAPEVIVLRHGQLPIGKRGPSTRRGKSSSAEDRPGPGEDPAGMISPPAAVAHLPAGAPLAGDLAAAEALDTMGY